MTMTRLKKSVCLALCFIMMLPLFCACSNKQPAEARPSLCDGKTLKILAITSSFGLDSTYYLYDIAMAAGFTDVVVARLYTSGCTLERHVQYARSEKAIYEYTKRDKDGWQTKLSATMKHGILDEDWDIIFMQQSAAQSAIITSYGNYIDQLMEYVNANKTNPNAKFIWNMTWAYQSDSEQAVFTSTFQKNQMFMYETLVKTLKEKIVPRTDFAAIIPTGTAIQNVRTSYIGDTLTRDTYHLNKKGQVIAGYTLFTTLVGKDLTEINFVPSNITISDNDKQVIIEAINAAMKKPYEVTQSSYTQG